MTEHRNIILTILLSVLVVFGWEYFYERPRMLEAERLHAEKQAAAIAQGIVPSGQMEDHLSRIHAIEATKDLRIPIITPRLKGSISLRGARFDDLTLTQYFVDQETKSQEVVLLSPANSDQAYYAYYGWLTQQRQLAVPGFSSLWTTTDTVIKPGTPATLTWDNGQGVIFRRQIAVDENYMFTITDSVENHAGENIVIAPFGVINKILNNPSSSFSVMHEGPIGVLGDTLKEVNYDDLKNEEDILAKNNHHGWLGISDKFWLTTMIPDTEWLFDARIRKYEVKEQNHYQTDYAGHSFSLPDGQTLTIKQRFFSGAKQFSVLDGYASTYNIPLFDRAIDFGVLYFLTKPLFIALKFLFSVFGNFGIAIIALTIIIKIILFPLANSSHISMYKIRKLQPAIERLKEKFKDDKLRFNQELMVLYRHEKINPLSGCLPILVQIPVFFALYKVLFVTIEMRHAPFFGWIHDLSAPDPTSVFNLFGLLPYQVPAFLAIGAWPLIMCVTMYIQQSLNPAPADPMQAKFMRLMPLIFLLMSSGFPAGLIIYWTVNNILSIGQQWYINQSMKTRAANF